jgi:hypothetical protein
MTKTADGVVMMCASACVCALCRMTSDPLHGWITRPTQWRPPIQPPPWTHAPLTKHVIDGRDWPGVEWPSFPKSLNPHWTGEGDWGAFMMATGGAACADYEPAAGYWCSNPPRGIAAPAHASGVYVTPKLLPNAFDAEGRFVYNDTRGTVSVKRLLDESPWLQFTSMPAVLTPHRASRTGRFGQVVHAWRPAHWFVNMWEVGNASSERLPLNATAGPAPASGDTPPATGVLLPFSRGGYQGAEGTAQGAEWYLENILEELDSPLEWYFDDARKMLYFLPNSTQPLHSYSTPTSSFVACKLKVLINITGSQRAPAHHVAIRGLTIRDTAYTYMDKHGLPSGGDCRRNTSRLT